MHLSSFLSLLWLLAWTSALTLPSLPSLDLNDSVTILNQTTVPQYDNLTSGGSEILGDVWDFTVEYGKEQLCMTALIVNAAWVLAHEAVLESDASVPSQTYSSVKGFEEVSMKITAYSDELTRYPYLNTIYMAIMRMKRDKSFVASRWTPIRNGEPVGRLDFKYGRSPSSGACRSDYANYSTLQGLTTYSSSIMAIINATTNDTELSAPPTLSVGADWDDDEPDVKVDFQWFGQKIDPFISLMAPITTLAKEPFAVEGIHRIAAFCEYLHIRSMDISFVAIMYRPSLAYNPDWTTYRIVKTLGRFPYAMADKERFDWREMLATVSVKGEIAGTIAMHKGQIPEPPSLVSLGDGGNSTLDARDISCSMIDI